MNRLLSLLLFVTLQCLATTAPAQPNAPAGSASGPTDMAKGNGPAGMAKTKDVSTYDLLIFQDKNIGKDITRKYSAQLEGLSQDVRRGYLMDLFGQSLAAAKQVASTSLVSLVSTGISMIGEMVKSKKGDWRTAVARENVFVKTLPMMENIEDFYSDVSFSGALDPSSLSFNGFGCLQKRDNDTVLYMVCHLDTTEYGVGRILRHSKFEMTLDTLVFNPYKCDLPNDSTMPYSRRDPFSFSTRTNLNLQISLNVMSSWINQAIQLQRDQTLGQFVVNVPINENTLCADSIFRFYRGSTKNKAMCDITGESFIVPRSYIGVRDANGKFHDAWGTGQYKMSMTLRETCSNTDAFDRNWKADWKARKSKKGHKLDIGKAMRQLWDANGSKWIMSIVEAPANMLTQDFLSKIGFVQSQAMGSASAAMGANAAMGASSAAGNASANAGAPGNTGAPGNAGAAGNTGVPGGAAGQNPAPQGAR